MNKFSWASVVAVCLFVPSLAFAQSVQVNRDNRTIAVAVTETIVVEPEIAIVQIGYHNFGPTRDVAYQRNASAAQRIIDALLAVGVNKRNIETASVTLGRVDSPNSQWNDKERAERQLEAEQTWNIRVSPTDAQTVVDRAVAAGANELQAVNWTVTDLTALDAKAGDAALAKARGLAERMAQTFGEKAGHLLFVGNTQPNFRPVFEVADDQASRLSRLVAPPPPPTLILLPEKVRREATVYAVFALE